MSAVRVFAALILLSACAVAEDVELVGEYVFSDEAATRRQWDLTGDVRFDTGGAVTRAVESDMASRLLSRFVVEQPTGGAGVLTRIEWASVPLVTGNWGNDLYVNEGAVLVELSVDRWKLNQKHLSKARVQAGQTVVQRCDFNAGAVFSWTINGEEQLDAPVPSWRGTERVATITLVDFRDAATETRWLWLRHSRVVPDDLMALKLADWGHVPFVKQDSPAPFLLGQASSMTKVFREPGDFRGCMDPVVRLSAAGRERESFQLVVFPLGASLHQVRAVPTALVHEDGEATLAPDRISWGHVGYVQTQLPNSPTERIGWWWPDIVMPQEPFDAEVGFATPVWFTVDVPHATKPGRYRGIIDLCAEGCPPVSAGLELMVQPYSLPLRGVLKTAFSLNAGVYEAWYAPDEVRERLGGKERLNPEVLFSSNKTADVLSRQDWRRLYDFLFAHRLNPITIYSAPTDGQSRVLPAREDMEYCYERGLNAVCLGNVDVPWAGAEDLYMAWAKQSIGGWEGFVREKGWDDVTWFVHGFDESEMREDPEGRIDAGIRQVNGSLATWFPWLKRETANPYVERNNAYFDIWTPVTRDTGGEEAVRYRAAQEEGETVWAYVCCQPTRPYANLFIDFPGVDPRVLGWQLYQHELTGFLYYYINLWDRQENWDQDGPKWPERPWNPLAYSQNSDGILIYPGPDRCPLPSTRLENLRDGIEDYEALALLSELVQRARAAGSALDLVEKAESVLKVCPEVTTGWAEYTQDPGTILRARAEVDTLISGLSRACCPDGTSD